MGASPAIDAVRRTISRVAASAVTVLVEGETGTGKEVVARAIHAGSARASRPFLQLNCAAIPQSLLESQLFGHEKGAFADAHTQRHGVFETAEGGTVLLDEMGDLSTAGQATLLRLLEDKTFRRVGGVAELRADVRVIAATNVDLEKSVAIGRFRPDLFFRINLVRIRLPALRERPEDVVPLAAHFIAQLNAETNWAVGGISPEAMDALVTYEWPGNVRELRNVLERAFILFPNMDEVRSEHLPSELRTWALGGAMIGREARHGLRVLEHVERQMVADAFQRARGNQTQAARLLGLSRFQLRYRLRKHGIH